MGVRDQQEALRWVRDHISAFGGDPAHVTIFGQSAGGISVCWHLAAPLSRGLFHAAIAESATCDTPDFFLKAADQLSFGAMYAEDKFGCAATLNQTSWLDCARRASVGDIMNGVMSWFGPNWPGSSDLDLTKARFPTGLFHSFANIAMGNTLPFLAPMFPFGPVIDGTKQGTPELPLTALQQGRANYVPTIFGTTKDEGSIFVPMLAVVVPNATWPISGDTDVQTALHHFFPSQMVAKVMLLYTLADYSGSQEQRMAAILRDYIFACPSRRAARAVDTHLPHKSWLYHFEYPMHWAEKSLGNYHTSELYYLFGTKGPELKDVPLVHDFNAHDRTMSATFQRLWGNMARWQTPNGQAADGNVFWPNHNASDDMNIVLTVPPAPQVGLYRDKCDFWDTHMASVAEGGARRQVLQRVLHRARNTSNGGSLQALSV